MLRYAADLAELVEKLPVTADGVRVVPTFDVVYFRNGPNEKGYSGKYSGVVQWMHIGRDAGWFLRWGVRPVAPASECYSTIDLAEAAFAARKERSDE
jgi:hypothetical protein